MTEETSGQADHDAVKRLRDRISSLVVDRFSSGADTYYLSQLGNELGPDRDLPEKLMGLKLSEYIERELGFELGRAGQHRNVLYIVRPGQAGVRTEPPKPGIPRYRSRFWAAFVVPLDAGECRYINLETHEFGPNEAALKAIGGDIRPIKPEYIAPRDAAGSAAEIAGRIERWLQDQQLDCAPFLLGRRRPAGETTASLLDQFLGALDGDQLKRVSLPLDVIRTMSERRFR